MAIALIGSQHNSFASGGASQTQAFDATGADFLVVAVAQFDNDVNISGITYAGAAMTFQVSDQTDGAAGAHERVAIYTRIAPTTGSNNVVVSFSPSNQYGCDLTMTSWSGVHQTVPVGNVNGKYKENTDITSPYTLTLTISAGSVAVDGLFINSTTITKDAAQTGIINDPDAGTAERIGASYKAGATSNMAWTYTGSPTRAALAAIEILPVGAGGGRTTKNTRASGLGMELGMGLWTP